MKNNDDLSNENISHIEEFIRRINNSSLDVVKFVKL